MRRTRCLTALLLALILPLAACGDDDEPTGNDDPVAELAGTWTAQSFVYTADDDPNTTVDLTQLPGGLGIQSLTIAADGSFTGTVALPDVGNVPLSGSLSNVTGSSMTITFTGAAAQALTNPLVVSYTLSGDILTFEADDVTFDFTLQGNAEVPANLTVTLVRS